MSRFDATSQRLRKLAARERRGGASLSRVVLWLVPRRAIAKLVESVINAFNDRVLSGAVNEERLRDFQQRHATNLGGHFYVIVMPGTLHFLLPCLRLIPPEVRVLLLLNGTTTWEVEFLRDHCARYPILTLATLRGSSLSHGAVIDLLLEHNSANFGLVDHDFFVLNPGVFRNLELRQNECAVGAYRVVNRRVGLEFPTTHFLYFNTPQLKKVRSRHEVGARVYTSIPARLRPALASMGLGYHNFLKDYLDYFDTLNLLFAMALHDGQTFKFLRLTAADCCHIGGTSRPSVTPSEAFLHERFLAMTRSRVLADHYSGILLPARRRKELPIPQARDGEPEVLRRVRTEAMLARIEARLSEVGCG